MAARTKWNNEDWTNLLEKVALKRRDDPEPSLLTIIKDVQDELFKGENEYKRKKIISTSHKDYQKILAFLKPVDVPDMLAVPTEVPSDTVSSSATGPIFTSEDRELLTVMSTAYADIHYILKEFDGRLKNIESQRDKVPSLIKQNQTPEASFQKKEKPAIEANRPKIGVLGLKGDQFENLNRDVQHRAVLVEMTNEQIGRGSNATLPTLNGVVATRFILHSHSKVLKDHYGTENCIYTDGGLSAVRQAIFQLCDKFKKGV